MKFFRRTWVAATALTLLTIILLVLCWGIVLGAAMMDSRPQGGPDTVALIIFLGVVLMWVLFIRRRRRKQASTIDSKPDARSQL